MSDIIFPLRRACIFFLIPLVVSCAILHTGPRLTPRIPFPMEEYARLPLTGTGTVTGSASIKLGGNLIPAAGERVILNPVTSYSRQWYTVSYMGQSQLEPPDRRIGKYIKSTIADSQGQFTFRNVPPGEYYIITVVSWEAPGDTGEGGHAVQGTRLCRIITVANHKETKVILK